MISIVTVNWNSGPFLERCVASLLEHAPEAEIVIVDNASDDESLRFLDSVQSRVHLTRNAANAGFAAAGNQGWRRSRGDLILFLNPDAEAAPKSVEQLSRALEADLSVWAAGGKLLSPSGKPQRGFNVRAFPTKRSVAAEMLLLDELWPRNPWTSRYRLSDWNHESRREVDQPAGACLLVRREALEQLGGFDESFTPAWFEDVDLCRRIRDAGGKIVFEPSAHFTHHGGSSLRRLDYGDFLRYFHTNQIRYFRKHHSEGCAATVRRLIWIGLVLRAGLSLVHSRFPDRSRASAAAMFWRSARQIGRLEAAAP